MLRLATAVPLIALNASLQAGEGQALAAHVWLPDGLLVVAGPGGEVRAFAGKRPAGSFRLDLPGAPLALLPRGRGLLALYPDALAVCAPPPRHARWALRTPAWFELPIEVNRAEA